jgi:hypothetical protein
LVVGDVAGEVLKGLGDAGLRGFYDDDLAPLGVVEPVIDDIRQGKEVGIEPSRVRGADGGGDADVLQDPLRGGDAIPDGEVGGEEADEPVAGFCAGGVDAGEAEAAVEILVRALGDGGAGGFGGRCVGGRCVGGLVGDDAGEGEAEFIALLAGEASAFAVTVEQPGGALPGDGGEDAGVDGDGVFRFQFSGQSF